jgi:ABC-2 type transport system permease protein
MQPVIYLLLFGSLFKRVVDLPGFAAGSYITFLTPGIVVMSAVFGAGWSGMGVIEDLDRGVLDRFLVSPASRVALIAGRLVQVGLVTVIQALIIIALGLLAGARFPGGAAGLLVLIGCAVLLAVPIGALSSGMALIARKEESVIAAANFVLLPLTFLSSVFMARNLMPGWMQDAARFNPVDWAVQAGRAVLSTDPNWSTAGWHALYLAAFAVVCTAIAARAFRAYQRSV